MKKVDKKNLLEEIKKLGVKQTIFIPISEDIGNVMKLTDIKIQSYNNLFMSYVNSTGQSPNRLNIDNFFKQYTDTFTKSILLRDEVIKEVLADAYEYFMSNPFRYMFDFNLNLLKLTRMGESNDKS